MLRSRTILDGHINAKFMILASVKPPSYIHAACYWSQRPLNVGAPKCIQ